MGLQDPTSQHRPGDEFHPPRAHPSQTTTESPKGTHLASRGASAKAQAPSTCWAHPPDRRTAPRPEL